MLHLKLKEVYLDDLIVSVGLTNICSRRNHVSSEILTCRKFLAFLILIELDSRLLWVSQKYLFNVNFHRFKIQKAGQH